MQEHSRFKNPDRGIKIGLVGCGYIAEQVHLPVWQKFPRARVVACVDQLQDRANLLAKEFGILNAYSEFQTMLDQEQVDLVDVCTPPHTHAEILKEVLNRGFNCIVEKPLTLKYDEAESLVSLAKSTGTKLYVVHNYSYVPAIRKVKRMVLQGKVGDVKIVDTQYLAPLSKERYFSPDHWIHNLPGGVLSTEITPHLFMLVLEQMATPKDVRFSFSKATDLTYVAFDEMCCTIISEKNEVAHVGLSFNSTLPLHTFNMVGTKGVVTADLYPQTVVYHALPRYQATDLLAYNKRLRGLWALSDIYQRTTSLMKVGVGVALGKAKMRTEGHRYLFERCVEDLSGTGVYPVTLSDVLKVVKMVELMGDAAKQKVSTKES